MRRQSDEKRKKERRKKANENLCDEYPHAGERDCTEKSDEDVDVIPNDASRFRVFERKARDGVSRRFKWKRIDDGINFGGR